MPEASCKDITKIGHFVFPGKILGYVLVLH